jgi:beta-N-acetylhexosaminidase
MRARRLAPGLAVVLLAAGSACQGPRALAASRSDAHRSAAHACDPSVTLSSWSLARLAAQVVAIPVQADGAAALGPEVTTGFGGILLFGTQAPANLGATMRAFQAATPQRLGLFVMTDEEGGGVRRLDNLVGSFPWARTMATTMTSATIAATATRVGAQLLAAGVTMDLAPVLDVDGRDVDPGATDPDGYRSFGGNVSVVITDGEAFASGLARAGELAVVKHFPGLGGSTGNTDDGPAATLPWPQLKSSALRTFETAINREAPAIMVSNAHVPGLTPLPASLSSTVMVGVLRMWLHFHGMLVTDSLTAGAISATGVSVPTAAVEAIAAGADLVLLGSVGTTSHDVGLALSVAHALVAAVGKGHLSRTTLIDAVTYDLAARGITAC